MHKIVLGGEVTHPTPTLDVLLKDLSEKYHVDPDLARSIIKCESQGNPDALNKNYRNGVHWSSDWSYWQINDYYHKEEMAELGLDIYNPEDNLEYGFILLSRDGVGHWRASSKCWDS